MRCHPCFYDFTSVTVLFDFSESVEPLAPHEELVNGTIMPTMECNVVFHEEESSVPCRHNLNPEEELVHLPCLSCPVFIKEPDSNARICRFYVYI